MRWSNGERGNPKNKMTDFKAFKVRYLGSSPTQCLKRSVSSSQLLLVSKMTSSSSSIRSWWQRRPRLRPKWRRTSSSSLRLLIATCEYLTIWSVITRQEHMIKSRGSWNRVREAQAQTLAPSCTRVIMSKRLRNFNLSMAVKIVEWVIRKGIKSQTDTRRLLKEWLCNRYNS